MLRNVRSAVWRLSGESGPLELSEVNPGSGSACRATAAESDPGRPLCRGIERVLSIPCSSTTPQDRDDPLGPCPQMPTYFPRALQAWIALLIRTSQRIAFVERGGHQAIHGPAPTSAE